MDKTSEISVFVDESGSFDATDLASRYYLVCMVFHDQSDDIAVQIEKLEAALAAESFDPSMCIHTAPLIRRENEYSSMARKERIGIFYRMLAFVRNAGIRYRCFCVDKRYVNRTSSIHDQLLREMVGFLVSHAKLFDEYDMLKVYYDNGQSQITSLLKEAFLVYSAKTVFMPDVRPAKYRLFQAADLICTLELLLAKLAAGDQITASEERFFGGVRGFKRNVVKQFKVKELP